jgi:Ca2+-binding RTX toxin-like protein
MRRALACSLAVLFLLPAPAAADHVTASPQVSARLGDRISDNAWGVIVDWSINCSGPAPGNANYTGNLNIDDVDTGEVIYMGGTSSASGSDVAPVSRRAQPRRMRPRIKASCFDGGIGNHGSETIEVTGNIVTVPALGDENGDGLPDGGGGGTPPPPGGGTPPPSGNQTPAGPCAVRRAGTPRGDALTGTAAGDLILGLAGNDVLRGLGGADCLVGGAGGDLLVGGSGADRLTGGAAGDLLSGGGGADRLSGGAGADRLSGGGSGDRLSGGAGGDRLSGGGGGDRLDGGAGTNRYDGGSGNDDLRARNGRAELVSCGSGRDRARVDRGDRVRGCERVTRG